MRNKFLIESLLCLLFFPMCIGCQALHAPTNIDSLLEIQGESLVLASTLPGQLCFDSISDGSVTVRSRYSPNDSLCTVYLEGVDYVVDYQDRKSVV